MFLINGKLGCPQHFHPPQVNTPRLNPGQGRYSVYLPQRDGSLSCPTYMVTYRYTAGHPSNY